MSFWLLQFNESSTFNIRAALELFPTIEWGLREKVIKKYFKTLPVLGDEGLIWLAKGKGNESGVIGTMKVLSEPILRIYNSATGLYIDPVSIRKVPRITIICKLWKNPLLINDPNIEIRETLESLPVMKQHQGSTYYLKDEQFNAIIELAIK